MAAITASRSTALGIGAASKLTGVNIETIRYYEKIGVLALAARAGNGRRIYGAREVRILAFVKRARELGFSLDEVRALLRLGGPGKASCREVRRIATHHLDDVRAKIDDLRRLERLLAKTVALCSGTTTPECPVLDVLDVRRAKADSAG